MKKLLTLLDNHIVKWATIFTLVFLLLYPKLPSIHIIRTWVYIRLEDFSIAAVAIIWLVQLIRRKVKLPLPVGIPLGIYWLVGLVSLLFCLIFIGPHLVGFFPHLAILEYGRRIEYMILFFVAFSTIRSAKDVRDYIIALCVALSAVVLYGFGQRFYLTFWALFPKFFEQYAFCFPSFQTGNEEFAKGLALCLPQEARITSTFGGHYDLAAFLVIVLPLLLGLFASAKKVVAKIGISVLFITSLMLLIFTASRVSFTAYLVGSILALIFMKQKKLLVPVVLVSIACLLIFSGSTAKRFLETFRIVNVVTTNQGQVVGVAVNNLPDSLKNKISKTDSVVVEAPPPTQNLPTGSSFITLSNTAVATSNAYVKAAIPTSEAQKLKLANGGLEISTVSGTFLIQKALVYDISFTTRFQAEWPNAWAAFMSSPLLGKGYSTITLATDNDYLRLLGETGIAGFSAFLLIFLVFALYLQKAFPESPRPMQYIAFGLAGGVIGLFFNASLIDVFEASKVAEPLWILLGVVIGGLSLTFTDSVAYIAKIKKVLTSHIFLISLLCMLAFFLYGGSLNNFFVADDFTWLKWAATAHPMDLVNYFVDAQGSIYRPIAKILMFVMYSVFAFQPTGYHVVGIFVHFFIGVGVYVLGLMILRKKLWAVFLAALYILLPVQAEVLFWISTISISWSTLFMVYALVSYMCFRKGLPAGRQGKSVALYGVALVLATLSLFTYEMGVVLPLLLILIDVCFIEKKLTKRTLLLSLPFFVLDGVYLLIRSHAHVASGGDYSYSLPHLLPNLLANYGSYAVTTFVGERAVAWQFAIRSIAKQYVLLTTTGLVALLGMVLLLLKLFWAKIHKTVLKLTIFGLLFSAVALLPFLGLGNIDERYGYLAAIGFAIVTVAIMQFLAEKIKADTLRNGILLLVGIAMLLYAKTTVDRELSQWVKASTITYNALAYIKVVKETVPSNATFYVSHLPTRYGNAWIFPVGFEDGLWFIYRENTPKVVKTKDVDESLSTKNSHPSLVKNNEFTFDFDKNGNVLQY